MKKWIGFLMILVLGMVLIGCGGETTIEEEDIYPDSITISGGKDEMEVGEELRLTATISPANATNKGVTWSSNATTIATIDNNGNVKAIGAGDVIITAIAKGKTSVKETYNITVKEKEVPDVPDVPDVPKDVDVTDIVITGKNEVYVGSTINLTISVLPNDATNKNVIWSSSDESIATVSSGTINAIKEGTVTIIVTSVSNSNIKKEFSVTIKKAKEEEILPTSIAIEGETEVFIGYRIRLLAVVSPAGANQSVGYESNNTERATVDESGWVTGVGKGTAYITVYSTIDESVKARYKINIKEDTSVNIELPDMGGYNIVLMGVTSPLSENYSSTNGFYEREALLKIQKDYNCVFDFQSYPVTGSTAQKDYVIDSANTGATTADIYSAGSDQLRPWATGGAIIDVTDFYSKWGKNQMELGYKQASTYKQKLWAFSMGITEHKNYVEFGLVFNVQLLEQYKIENPSKLFNEGKWSYSDFADWAIAAQALLPSGYHVMAGYPQSVWAGMVNSGGVRLVDTTNLTLNLQHKYSYDAINAMRKIVEAKAWDVEGIAADALVISFNEGRSLMQFSEYWYLKSENRWTTTQWGEDTRFGFCPFPYPDGYDLTKDIVYTNWASDSVRMMSKGKQRPANVSDEDVYRAWQSYIFEARSMQKADPTYDPEALKYLSLSAKIDDPESIKAQMYFTTEKTLFDPVFEGMWYDYSTTSGPAMAVWKCVTENADIKQGLDAYESSGMSLLVERYG